MRWPMAAVRTQGHAVLADFESHRCRLGACTPTLARGLPWWDDCDAQFGEGVAVEPDWVAS